MKKSHKKNPIMKCNTFKNNANSDRHNNRSIYQ